MARKRYNKERMARFDDWRRNNIPKPDKKFNMPLFSTDLDSLEYTYIDDSPKPCALIEKKDSQSQWKRKWRSAQLAQFALSQMANIPYYVVEHKTDFSFMNVYHITTVDRLPDDSDVILSGRIAAYIEWLYKIRDLELSEFYLSELHKVHSIDSDGYSVSFGSNGGHTNHENM
jgi:hypothetical protein